MSTYSWQDSAAVIERDLKKLTTDGGTGNFMIVSVGGVYVQFAGSRGG